MINKYPSKIDCRSVDNISRFYSKLPPFMNPGLHSGRDLRAEKLALKNAHADEIAALEPDTEEQVKPPPIIELNRAGFAGGSNS